MCVRVGCVYVAGCWAAAVTELLSSNSPVYEIPWGTGAMTLHPCMCQESA